jgi:hypothetical protein
MSLVETGLKPSLCQKREGRNDSLTKLKPSIKVSILTKRTYLSLCVSLSVCLSLSLSPPLFLAVLSFFYFSFTYLLRSFILFSLSFSCSFLSLSLLLFSLSHFLLLPSTSFTLHFFSRALYTERKKCKRKRK